MKIRIEVDPDLAEDEVLIRCKSISDDVAAMQQAITDISSSGQRFQFYNGEKEFYFSLDEILFFETDGSKVNAHTAQQVYQVKYRLYELEELLPSCFVRVAKSTILNVRHVHAITKNLTGASEVEFQGTHKHIYVSRGYYKVLKEKLESRRYTK